MKSLLSATLCLYVVWVVSSQPTNPVKTLLERLRNSNGTLDLQSVSDLDLVSSGSSRIVDGEKCPSYAKYAVSLQYGIRCPKNSNQPFQWDHFCTGTLVKCDKILTAGHCVYAIHELLAYNNDPNINCDVRIRAVYGSSKLELDPVPKNGEAKEIIAEQTCLPLGFSYSLLSNDIAFIHLLAPFGNCDSSWLPCPPACSRSQFCPGTLAVAFGFGVTSTDGTEASKFLKCANEKVICLRDCQKYYVGGGILGPWITCARGVNGGICFGDSGGGLVLNYPGYYTCPTRIIGVNSFVSAEGCGEGHPHGFGNLCEPELNAWFYCNYYGGLPGTYPPVEGASISKVTPYSVSELWSKKGSKSCSGGDDECKCKSECLCQAIEYSA